MFVRKLSLQSKALVFQTNGKPEKVLDVCYYPLQMDAESVRLKILAAPVNPSDINIIEGTYPIKAKHSKFGYLCGQEGVAEVEEVGSRVTNLYPGDLVVPLNQNTWQTHAVAKANQIVKLPNPTGIPIVSLGTISVNPPTAYRMLKDFVKLNEGDIVLQNCATSGVGQAVIQIAKAWGIKTVNIIRPRSDFEEVAQTLKSMGADLVVSEDDTRKQSVKDLINDLGGTSRLALNGVGGRSATNLARLLDDNGCMVTYGGMSREPITLPTSLLIFKNLRFSGFWLNKWFLSHPVQDRISIYQELFELIRKNQLREPKHELISFKNASDKELKQIATFETGSPTIKRILVP